MLIDQEGQIVHVIYWTVHRIQIHSLKPYTFLCWQALAADGHL